MTKLKLNSELILFILFPGLVVIYYGYWATLLVFIFFMLFNSVIIYLINDFLILGSLILIISKIYQIIWFYTIREYHEKIERKPTNSEQFKIGIKVTFVPIINYAIYIINYIILLLFSAFVSMYIYAILTLINLFNERIRSIIIVVSFIIMFIVLQYVKSKNKSNYLIDNNNQNYK